jgi:hypothetical protein
MGDLRPLGSEKLGGIDKIKRIMEIARYNETLNPIKEEETNSLQYHKTISDGYTYGIVKEKNGYIIKKSLNEAPMEYLDNMKSRKYYRSYSEALKRLNLIVKESNRLTGYQEDISLIGEQKFVLKTKKTADAPPAEPAGGAEPAGMTPPAGMDVPPAGAEPPAGMDMPPAGAEPPAGMGTDTGMEPMAGAEPGMEPGMGAEPGMEPGMGAEPGMEPGMGAEPGMEEPDMGEDEEEMGPVGLKTIQKLTGRLSQKIRMFDKEKGLDSQDIKYVVNSILSAIDLTKLDDEDRDDILDKLEQYESYGEEGEGDLDMEGMDMEEPEMGAEPGMEPGMEEPAMGEETPQPPVAESKVERLLMSYFDVKKSEKPVLEEKIKKEYLNQKIKTLKIKNEVINMSESKKQMDLGVSLLNENYKFVGKTNQENLVFTKNGRQVKVTPRGRVI